MSKKLIGYVRVSSEISKIKGNSINNQINKVNDFCNLNDYQLVDVLKDEGKSGMEYSKRDGYLELIERCKSEDIDGVVVYSLSRIGRRMKDVVDIMELFSNNNIQFYSVKENINNNEPITFFEILTACYFYKAAQFPDNINLIEAGLFHRFDATNILKENLASVVTSISKDHLDWLEKDQQTIEKIVFEKTSKLLTSNIIVAKQSTKETMDCIKKNINFRLFK